MHPITFLEGLAWTLLAIHIGAGFAALAVGGAIVALTKGNALHRRLGRIFGYAMLTVAATAVALAVLRPNVFLFTIALFSFYLVATGWLAARQRSAAAAGAWDLALAVFGAIAAAAMLAAAGLLWEGGGVQPAVLTVFGLILGVMAGYDLLLYGRGGAKGPARIGRHLQRMTAAWIASLTAFAVVNLDFLPDLVVWLGPTLLVSPLITYWSQKLYRGRLKMG